MRAAAGLVFALAAASPALADMPVLELRAGAGVVAATAEDILGAVATEYPVPSLSLRFKAGIAREISMLTGANIGEEAQLSICGKVLMRPIIRERIAGGSLVVTPIPVENLQTYLLVLTGEAPCPTNDN